MVKHFGRRTALDGVSFTARPGRVSVLLGPNGSGKTTVLRVLLGLIRATEGAATFGGHRYRDLPEPLRAVGTQLSTGARPRRGSRDHLRLHARAAGVPTARADELLAAVGLGAAAHRPVSSLSLGMSRRLGLAAALIGNPAVLVLDEPQLGLDPDALEWLNETVRAQARAGRTVLLATHHLPDAEALADDLVVLRDGRLAAVGPMAEHRGRLATVIVETPSTEPVARLFTEAGFALATVTSAAVHIRCERLEPVRELLARNDLPGVIRPGRTTLEELVRTDLPLGGGPVLGMAS